MVAPPVGGLIVVHSRRPAELANDMTLDSTVHALIL